MRAAIVVLSFALGMLFSAPAHGAERCGDLAGDEEALAFVWSALDAACGCAPAPQKDWKSAYRAFSACAKSVVAQAIEDGNARAKCRSTLLRGIRRSTCARPEEWTTCCLTNRRGRTSCRLRKHADRCVSTASHTAVMGESATCLDACHDVAGEPGGPGGPACEGTGPPTHGLSPQEETLLQLINGHRRSEGAAPVEACVSLNRAAQDHANDLRDRKYFAHKGKNGSEFWERACDAGYSAGCGPTTWMGEIIAGYDAAPQGAFDQWLNSPGHEYILSTANYTRAGIGRACGGPLGHYWVVDFAAAAEPSCE